MLNSLLFILTITFINSVPLTFAALGGVICEKSGVVNIGIEGMMSIGAFMGAAVGYYTGSVWWGLICAGLGGGLLALLHAVAAVTFQADQTVSGIAINLIGPGVAMFLSRMFFAGATTTVPVSQKFPKIFSPLGSKWEFFNNINVDVTVPLSFLVVLLTWFVMYKTKWGLRIRALGEHPAAVDSVGVSVYRTRYICVVLSGILAGIGGASVTLAIVSQFTPSAISGQGFIALAAVIFGKWKPFGAYFACLFFGFAQALVVLIGGEGSVISSDLLMMLPYLLTILVLILFVGKSSAPKASGKPYQRGSR
jgi:Uncharacterized ABC-type transport system, permease component